METETRDLRAGDRVVSSWIDTLGWKGTVVSQRGSIYPDPAKKLVLVQWDRGDLFGELKRCLTRAEAEST